MKIQTQPPKPPQQPNAPQQPPQPPPSPESFGDKFTAAADHAGSSIAGTLYPLSFCFLGSRIGSRIGGAIGGQVGSFAGSLGLSMVGYRYGQYTAQGASQLVNDIAGGSKGGHAALNTLYATALGGVMLGSVGGFTPANMALGAGATLVGLAGYAAFKAARD